MPTPLRRRWFQFGLRSLLIAVTACGLVAAATPSAIETYRKWFPAAWEDDGGGGTIMTFTNSIECSFGPFDDAQTMAIESLPGERQY